MDPLSVTASVAGIATAAFQIIGFISIIKSGGKERLALCQELGHLGLSLNSLQQQLAPDNLVDDKIPATLLPLFEPDGVIHDIELEIQKLEKKLKAQSSHGKLRQSLAWPLHQQDVLQIIERVHRLQQTIHLALTQSNHWLTQEIYRDGQAVKHAIDEGKKREIIEWISPLDFLAKQKQIFGEHHKGTCKWFLDRKSFRAWREGEGEVLFGPGIPGAGKTFLSSIVVEELERLRLAGEGGVQDAAIAVLYCKWDSAPSQLIDQLLASVLKQVMQKYPVLDKDTVEDLSRCIATNSHLGLAEITRSLTKLLEKFPKVFIVVDGLDELSKEKTRRELLQTLRSLHSCVNLMVTARPLHNIVSLFHSAQDGAIECDGCGERGLKEFMHCNDCHQSFDLCQPCFDQGKRCGYKGHLMVKLYMSFVIPVSAVTEDLKTYVEWRIQGSDFLQSCIEIKKGLGLKILETVVDRNGGMFLLARFNMDTLESKLNTRQVLTALETLPKELEGTYTDAMSRIAELPKDIRVMVMEFLRWVVFAKEPMTDIEIEHALAVTAGDTDIDRDNITGARVLADKCAGLVEFDNWNRARLVHFSAQNFFFENHAQWLPDGSAGLASTCLTFLLFDPFKSGACTGPSESADFYRRVDKYPFLQYAALHWASHLLDTPSKELYEQATRLLSDAGYFATATQALWYLDHKNATSWAAKDGSSALHLAAHLGVSELVGGLLQAGSDPNAKDANGATPLMLAADRGHVAIARTLIAAGASVNTVDNVGAAPLHAAIINNRFEITKLLLQQKDIDVNVAHPRVYQYTPLFFAAKYGRASIIRLLLDSPHLDVNKECSDPPGGATALMVAAAQAQDNFESVRLLLSHPDIDINHQDGYGVSAIVEAAQHGNEGVVEALLDAGVDTETAEYGSKGTALLRAIDYNRISVVKLLLRRGANVHHKDSLARGMLHGAACNNRFEIIRILLEFDPTLDVNMQDANGLTTLHDAARLQYPQTAAVLLERGADPTIQDYHGRTPIRIAREMNNTEMIDQLRAARQKQKDQQQNPAPKESQDSTHPSPSPEKKAEEGTEAGIQPVQRTDTQALIDAPLPLWALAKACLDDELRDRLQKGTADAEINLTDPDMGQSALHYTAVSNNTELIHLLIAHGADINLRCRYGRTPIHLAAAHKSKDAAEVLIDAGAYLNYVDCAGCSLLYAASICDPEIATLLVAKGIELDDPKVELDRLLILAAAWGDEVAVRRLVEAGADPWRKDPDGWTPHSAAVLSGHDEVADLIVRIGQPLAAIPKVRDGEGGADGPDYVRGEEPGGLQEVKKKLDEKRRLLDEKDGATGNAEGDLKSSQPLNTVQADQGSARSPLGRGIYIMLMMLVLIAATLVVRVY